MNRSVRWLGVLVACALGGVACSSSSKPPAPVGQGGSTIATVPPPPPPQPLSVAVQACSLATPAQVQGLLGAPAIGIEADHNSAYRTCNWTKNGAAPGTADTMSLAVLRLGGGQIGFTHTRVAGFAPQTVKGLGDVATFASGRNSHGFTEAILFADEGDFSIAIAVTASSANPDPASVRTQLVTVTRAAFVKLGAHPSTSTSTTTAVPPATTAPAAPVTTTTAAPATTVPRSTTTVPTAGESPTAAGLAYAAAVLGGRTPWPNGVPVPSGITLDPNRVVVQQ